MSGANGVAQAIPLSLAGFGRWLHLSALPLWATLGVMPDGAFAETLSGTGDRPDMPRRARVQARQIWVFCEAGRVGWQGPWRAIVTAALARFHERYERPDGRYRTLVDAAGTVIDDTAMLYDQAFVGLALSAAWGADIDRTASQRRAGRLLDQLETSRLAQGGWREAGEHPFQSNAHMHLLEAALAWEALDVDPRWSVIADHIIELAATRFIDRDGGFLREFFNADWSPADGDDGRIVEPGHQFEWAWLLARYAQSRSRPDITLLAHGLHRRGLEGVDAMRGVAMDAMSDAGPALRRTARLWPQTEWIKSACRAAESDVRLAPESADVLEGFRALSLYLDPYGLWGDRMSETGEIASEPAPASSLYHIMAAFLEWSAAGEALDIALD